MQNGHLIEASTLKISAFLKNLILGRGFGSVFRHQYHCQRSPRKAGTPREIEVPAFFFAGEFLNG